MSEDVQRKVTLRCPLCFELTSIDLSDAQARPPCESCERPILLDRPIKVDQNDFDETVLRSASPVLVDFYADWCGPCKWVAPIMDEVAQANVGRMWVAKVDLDRARQLAEQYGIRSIPTLILFDGGVEVDRSVGLEPEKIQAMVAGVAG